MKKEKLDYLEDYVWLKYRLSDIESEMRLQNKPNYGNRSAERVKSSNNTSRTERDGIDKAEDKLNKERERICKKMEEIENSIEESPSEKERILLRMIFIDGKTAKEVGSIMKLGIRTVYRIRDEALMHLQLGNEE